MYTCATENGFDIRETLLFRATYVKKSRKTTVIFQFLLQKFWNHRFENLKQPLRLLLKTLNVSNPFIKMG